LRYADHAPDPPGGTPGALAGQRPTATRTASKGTPKPGGPKKRFDPGLPADYLPGVNQNLNLLLSNALLLNGAAVGF